MVALIALISLVVSYYILSSLNRTSAEINSERNQTTLQSLKEAKAAMIAFAASESSGSTDQPGYLPCPSADALGSAASTCASNAARIGRLPWTTIGASDLRDGSGEILWYALSANYRKASGTTVINSDTRGTLTVTGMTPASDIVAVIIAPGQALGGQNRAQNSASNFLEGFDTSGTDLSFLTAASTETFNDQLITITRADIMAVVEPAVLSRIDRDIKPDLQTYLSQWQRFPFPASFTGGPGNPGTNTVSGTPSTRLQSAYLGDNTMTAGRGLMPIDNSVTYPWVAGSGAVAITGGTAGGVTGTSCVSIVSPLSGWKCNFNINAINLGNPGYLSSTTCLNPGNGTRYQYCIVNPAFTVAGDLSNAGLSFARVNPTTATDVTVTNASGSSNRSMSAKSIAWALKSDGSGVATFTVSGTHSYSNYSSSNFTRTFAVTIPDRVNVSPFTSPADATAGWFISNEWYRQIYYVVSPGYLPLSGAAGACSPSPATPTCLSVSGLSTTAYPTANDKRAILIMGGYSLNSSLSRPQAALSAYFEDVNATPGGADGYSYRHHTGPPATTNDRVIVIAP